MTLKSTKKHKKAIHIHHNNASARDVVNSGYATKKYSIAKKPIKANARKHAHPTLSIALRVDLSATDRAQPIENAWREAKCNRTH